jgi:hypothetical protein
MCTYDHPIDKIVGRCDDETPLLMTLENGSTMGIHTYLFFFHSFFLSFLFDILSICS